MYDSIKEEKEATLIIKFEEEEIEKGPKSFTILNQTIPIKKDISEYKIHLKDKSLNENKVYECFLQYESKKISCFLKVNYGQENSYNLGRKINSKSFEFIFADFANQKINNDRCYVKYNGKKYFANDDKNFSKLRCLNLINIDLKLLELPLSFENKVISHDIFNDSSFLVFVSVAEEKRKIFGIYQNKPFIEKELKITGKQIIDKLKVSLNNVNSVLNYDKNKTFDEYFNGIQLKNVRTIYLNELRNSIELEQEINQFFNFYRPNLTDEEILAFDTYSEFMLAFPDFKTTKRKNKNLNTFKFLKQHYFSHKVIENFEKTIPSKVSKKERTLLKCSACRCLRTLLRNDLAIFKDNLFHLCDLNDPNNIYNEAKKFNEIFIDNLTENSEMFLFFIQINSGSSINKLTNDLTARFSMLKLEQIKEHLRNSIPDYIIRMDYHCGINGITFNESKCTFISEVDVLGYFLDDQELKGGNTDEKYNKRLILSNLLQHERFGHIKFSLNFYSFKQDKGKSLYNPFDDKDEPSSPRQFYQIKNEENKNDEKFAEVTRTEKFEFGEVKIGEAGVAFNLFLTRGDEENMNILRFIEADFTKVFSQPQLFAANDLTELNKLIKNSAANCNLSDFKLKKISEGKYELSSEKEFSLDCIPTKAKCSP